MRQDKADVASSSRSDPARMEDLRQQFIDTAKKYFGVPYAKKYWDPETSYFHSIAISGEEYKSPIFLDCCGLVRRICRDMKKELGFKIGRWNQAYMYDTLPITLTKSQMKPGDLVFMKGEYVNKKRKNQRHNMTHVEIWLGDGDKTIGSRWNNGKVGVFESYKFNPKSFQNEKYIFKSIDTWLLGICRSHCPKHTWKIARQIKDPKSIFNRTDKENAGFDDESADLESDDETNVKNTQDITTTLKQNTHENSAASTSFEDLKIKPNKEKEIQAKHTGKGNTDKIKRKLNKKNNNLKQKARFLQKESPQKDSKSNQFNKPIDDRDAGKQRELEFNNNLKQNSPMKSATAAELILSQSKRKLNLKKERKTYSCAFSTSCGNNAAGYISSRLPHRGVGTPNNYWLSAKEREAMSLKRQKSFSEFSFNRNEKLAQRKKNSYPSLSVAGLGAYRIPHTRSLPNLDNACHRSNKTTQSSTSTSENESDTYSEDLSSDSSEESLSISELTESITSSVSELLISSENSSPEKVLHLDNQSLHELIYASGDQKIIPDFYKNKTEENFTNTMNKISKIRKTPNANDDNTEVSEIKKENDKQTQKRNTNSDKALEGSGVSSDDEILAEVEAEDADDELGYCASDTSLSSDLSNLEECEDGRGDYTKLQTACQSQFALNNEELAQCSGGGDVERSRQSNFRIDQRKRENQYLDFMMYEVESSDYDTDEELENARELTVLSHQRQAENIAHVLIQTTSDTDDSGNMNMSQCHQEEKEFQSEIVDNIEAVFDDEISGNSNNNSSFPKKDGATWKRGRIFSNEDTEDDKTTCESHEEFIQKLLASSWKKLNTLPPIDQCDPDIFKRIRGKLEHKRKRSKTHWTSRERRKDKSVDSMHSSKSSITNATDSPKLLKTKGIKHKQVYRGKSSTNNTGSLKLKGRSGCKSTTDLPLKVESEAKELELEKEESDDEEDCMDMDALEDEDNNERFVDDKPNKLIEFPSDQNRKLNACNSGTASSKNGRNGTGLVATGSENTSTSAEEVKVKVKGGVGDDTEGNKATPVVGRGAGDDDKVAEVVEKKATPKATKLPGCMLPSNMTPTFFIGGQNGAALVEEPLVELGWKRITDKFDERYRLKWVECKNKINYSSFKEGQQLVNHIPNSKLLTNKMGLLCSLQEYERVTWMTKGRLPRLRMSDFVPETYKLDDRVDRDRFLEGYKNGETWICKPTGMSQGKGIFLLRSREEIENVITERDAKNKGAMKGARPPMLRIVQRSEENGSLSDKENKNQSQNKLLVKGNRMPFAKFLQRKKHKYVYRRFVKRIVQRYINNPLLLEGRKFDIRSYMFIASTVPFLVLYHSGYVRLSCQKYNSDDTNLTTHLTNQFVQKKDPTYKDVKESTAWTIEKLNEYLNENFSQSKDAIIPQDWVYGGMTKQMQRITLHCFNSVKHKLNTKIGYFDLYGLDFMIDTNFKVWLIEINSNPALHTNCAALKQAIPTVVRESLLLAIECFDKSRKNQPLMPLNHLQGYHVLYCGSSLHLTGSSKHARSLSPSKENTAEKKNTVNAQAPARKLSPVRNLPRMSVSNTQVTAPCHTAVVSSLSTPVAVDISKKETTKTGSKLPTINIGSTLVQNMPSGLQIATDGKTLQSPPKVSEGPTRTQTQVWQESPVPHKPSRVGSGEDLRFKLTHSASIRKSNENRGN